MAYGDPQNYCEIYEVSIDHNGREIENCIARWISPDEAPSLPALERQTEKLGREVGKTLQCRIIER